MHKSHAFFICDTSCLSILLNMFGPALFHKCQNERSCKSWRLIYNLSGWKTFENTSASPNKPALKWASALGCNSYLLLRFFSSGSQVWQQNFMVSNWDVSLPALCILMLLVQYHPAFCAYKCLWVFFKPLEAFCMITVYKKKKIQFKVLKGHFHWQL